MDLIVQNKDGKQKVDIKNFSKQDMEKHTENSEKLPNGNFLKIENDPRIIKPIQKPLVSSLSSVTQKNTLPNTDYSMQQLFLNIEDMISAVQDLEHRTQVHLYSDGVYAGKPQGHLPISELKSKKIQYESTTYVFNYSYITHHAEHVVFYGVELPENNIFSALVGFTLNTEKVAKIIVETKTGHVVLTDKDKNPLFIFVNCLYQGE